MKTWKDDVKNAKHFLAVGQKEIYLGHDAPEFPWHLVTGCKPGGSHRLEIPTDVWFQARDKSGLEFRWNFDIEPYSANGKSSYDINVVGIQEVLAKLPSTAAKQFRAYLADCAIAVQKKAAEWQAIADKQRKTAEALGEASR